MGIEIDVSTRKSECYAGDAIEGTVQLTVTAVRQRARYSHTAM